MTTRWRTKSRRERICSDAFAVRTFGLNQMYSLKYGTVPIVRATGGLDDSIEPFDLEHGTGTGLSSRSIPARRSCLRAAGAASLHG